MARTEGTWVEYTGSYVAVPWEEGRDVLVRGVNRYINFGTIVGNSGYGIRDNAGTLQFKNSGGSWQNIASAAGGSAHIIQDEGSSLTARANLNFVGAGVAATDDAANDATIVTITTAGISVEKPSGTINGTNVTFTVTVIPKFISYGTPLFEGANGYSRSGLTITMPFPPTPDMEDQFKAIS